jgi:hypothetical protein
MMQRTASLRADLARRALPPLAALATLLAPPAKAAVDVGVGITIREPGVYGRIEIGTAPPPPVLYPRPVVIAPPPVPLRPIYLYVPPGHAKDWAKHCKHYNACNQPVYFVQEGWVQTTYDKAHPGKGKGRGNGNGNGKGGPPR